MFDDFITDVEGGFRRGKEVWRGEAEYVDDAKRGGTVQLQGFVDRPKLWTAEEPNGYTIVVTTEGEDGITLQSEGCR